MYSKFRLNWENIDINVKLDSWMEQLRITNDYKKKQREYESNQKEHNDKLQKYFQNNTDEWLNAENIQHDWFPLNHSQIFISHSHKDLETALKIKYLIETVFNIKVFVDYTDWGNVINLLQQLKWEFSGVSENNNNAAICAYIMLAEVLVKMLDKCECIFFLQTNNSVIKNKRELQFTSSTWIHHELFAATYLRSQSPAERMKSIQESGRQMKYPIHSYLKGFIDLSINEFHDWVIKGKSCSGIDRHPLELLYQRVSPEVSPEERKYNDVLKRIR